MFWTPAFAGVTLQETFYEIITFRWRPFQSALSGSLFFIPPALPEVMILSPLGL
jgi:hypothetical protein